MLALVQLCRVLLDAKFAADIHTDDPGTEPSATLRCLPSTKNRERRYRHTHSS